MNRKKLKILIAIAILSPLVLIIISNVTIELATKGKTYFNTDDIAKNKVGLVLGTSKYRVNGEINPYFKYRIDAAETLYKSGKIDYILVSGDNATKNYNEPSFFRDELVNRGIPYGKIYLDYAGFRTLDSIVRSKEIFGQDNITIISQQFHNERAIYLAEQFGINAIGFNAKDVKGQSGLKVKLREYLARTKMFLDIFFGVEPKFYGEKIEIG